MYTVYNDVGGIIHRGCSLERAMQVAINDDTAEPYIHSARGKRPVVLDQRGQPHLGNYGESLDDFRDRLYATDQASYF
jgi:hypothetical protein